MCPGEKRWGKCVPFEPASVGFIRALLWSVRTRRATPAAWRHITALIEDVRGEFCLQASQLGGKKRRGRVWSLLPFQESMERSPTKGGEHRRSQAEARQSESWRHDVEFSALICKWCFGYRLWLRRKCVRTLWGCTRERLTGGREKRMQN